MGHYDFLEDLPESQKKEILFVEKAIKNYAVKQIGKFGKNNKWDFILTSSKKHDPKNFEMKSDSMSYKTGNVVMEYSSRGKPSGIMTSQSDYYIYEVEKPNESDYYLIPTEKIRELVKNQIKSQFYWKKVVGGDKGSQTKMYLIKLSVFAKHAKLLKFH